MTLKNPTSQQTQIIEWFRTGAGNLVVRARAGTGKTTTIIESVGQAPEQKILMAAFNKEIAEELKKRVTDPRVRAQTLHSLGNWFCFKNWGKTTIDDKRGLRLAEKAVGLGDGLGINNGPKVSKEVIRAIAELASKAKNIAPFAKKKDLIALAQQFGIMAPDDGTNDTWTIDDLAGAAHVALELATHKDGSIDYDDMIFLPIRNKWVFPLYNLVVIDEAQDMNPIQLLLARSVCKKGGRIAVVGDDRQAIYGFRGADSEALDRLKHELKATELGLTMTHRCGKIIVETAAKLVPDFECPASAHDGLVDETSINKVSTLAKAGDFVLSRTNAPLITICLAILSQGRRAFIRGRDIGATLTSIVLKQSAETTTEMLQSLNLWKLNQLERLSNMDAPDSVIQTIEDQYDTICALSEGLVTTREVLARIASLFSNDDASTASTSVMCSSIHRAKGLEANRVFLLADTLYCFGKRMGEREEANIHYVGITRAKNHLTFAHGKA